MRNPDSTEWRNFKPDPSRFQIFQEMFDDVAFVRSEGFYAVLVPRSLRWWERLWFRLRPWPGSCRTYWGSHGCDRRRGHRGRHRCEGLIRNRCCHGYEAPPWWAPWRPDTTHYFGEDVPGDPGYEVVDRAGNRVELEYVDGGELRYPS